ncbi:MAG: SH3 domain-containing protein [Lachnospiraceae bacterium]|nr:SH3 domain-containing protein [Lachnospiraceae bacterium]
MVRSIRGSLKHVLAAMLFCMVLSVAPVSLADEQGTVIVESAKIRASADTSSEQLGSVAKGATVDIIGETTGTDGKAWYQIYADATTTGYIRADLVSKSGSSASTGTDFQTASASQTTSTTTEIEAKTGTVVTNSVNVRKSASTDSSVVATVSSGVTLTVSGQTTGTDGNSWYKVSFKYNDKDVEGYIRADLVTFENVADESAVSEITGEENATEQTEEETQTQEEAADEAGSSSDDTSDIILMNVDETPYIMPGFELVSLDWNDQKITAYRNGTFFIFYAQKQNGEEGWYMLDREEGVYQRYPYTTDGVTVPETGSLSGNLIAIIALVIIIVIMAVVIGILLIRLKRSTEEYYEYDDGDEEEDYPEDEEDIEELEDEPDEEPAPRPVRRPAQSAASQGQQPVRRPVQSGTPQGQQPVRRPAQSAASQGQQPARRPMQSGTSQGQQPVRRPVQSGTSQGQQPVRRPAASNTAAGAGRQTPERRGTNAQSNRPVQKGQKAKNLLENDDDMDFIDI